MKLKMVAKPVSSWKIGILRFEIPVEKIEMAALKKATQSPDFFRNIVVYAGR